MVISPMGEFLFKFVILLFCPIKSRSSTLAKGMTIRIARTSMIFIISPRNQEDDFTLTHRNRIKGLKRETMARIKRAREIGRVKKIEGS